MKSNIGKTFLNFTERYFPKTNKLRKIFNKNTVKVSYSCMGNMSSNMTPTVQLNSILDSLKYHLKNDLKIILEISSIKCILKALNYPNTYGI